MVFTSFTGVFGGVRDAIIDNRRYVDALAVLQVFGVFAKLASVRRKIVSDAKFNFSQLLAVLVCWVQKVVFTTRNTLVLYFVEFFTFRRGSQKTRNVFSIGEVVIFTFVTGVFTLV